MQEKVNTADIGHVVDALIDSLSHGPGANTGDRTSDEQTLVTYGDMQASVRLVEVRACRPEADWSYTVCYTDGINGITDVVYNNISRDKAKLCSLLSRLAFKTCHSAKAQHGLGDPAKAVAEAPVNTGSNDSVCSALSNKTHIVLINDTGPLGQTDSPEVFVFDDEPSEQELERLKEFYLSDMCPTARKEDLVVYVRKCELNVAGCPATAITSRRLSVEGSSASKPDLGALKSDAAVPAAHQTKKPTSV